jgi:uncharacterized protein
MKLARNQNIVAIKTDGGKVVGFHATNLQVARLDESAWDAVLEPAKVGGEIVDELTQWNSEVDATTTDAHLAQAARSLSVNVAQVCNLKCTYCAAGGDGTFGDPLKRAELEIIFEQIRGILHDIPEGEEFTLTFFGGEPLTAPHAIRSLARYTKLMATGRDLKLRFTVITNGTLVTEEMAELLAELGCHVTVSLDGPPEVNDKYRKTRGGQGSTARTLAGLQHLQKVRSRLGSLTVGSVFGKHHTGVLETYRFLKPFEFDSIKFDFAAENDDAEASREYADQLSLTADEAFRTGGEVELRRIALFDTYFAALDQQRRLQNHCGAGKNYFQIDARGRMTACQWFIGDAKEELGRGTKIDKERLAEYAQPLVELNNCGDCWARFLCGGGCMYANKLKSGSKHTKDQEFCNRTRSTIAKAIERYAEARVQDEGVEREIH